MSSLLDLLIGDAFQCIIASFSADCAREAAVCSLYFNLCFAPYASIAFECFVNDIPDAVVSLRTGRTVRVYVGEPIDVAPVIKKCRVRHYPARSFFASC